MRIAVIQQNKKSCNDYSDYIVELLSGYALQAGYEVKAWSFAVPAAAQKFSSNSVVIITVSAKSKFSLRWLYTVKLRFILKRIEPDASIFLNAAANNYAKKQSLFSFDDEKYFNKSSSKTSAQKYTSRNFGKYVRAQNNLISFSDNVFASLKKFSPEKKFLLHKIPYTATSDFHAVEEIDKLLIKAQFSENKEYFVCLVNDDEEAAFITLLKAFSKFKKWQQSSMQLLLIPKYENISAKLSEKLASYKYRNDVKTLHAFTLKETASVVASAYALLHVPVCEADILPAVIGLQCATPIITFNNIYLREYCNAASLYASENNFETLGDEIMLLFKNEELRKQMVDACKIQTALLTRKTVAESLWKLAETISSKPETT